MVEVCSVLCLVLSAICNALMDTIVHHYPVSILTRFNKPHIWDGQISWKNKYQDRDPSKPRVKLKIFGKITKFNKPVQLTDAWHFFKSLMIVSMIIGFTLYPRRFNPLADIMLLGIIWNIVFYAFYNKILRN